jgi:hypothetical protein
MFSLRRLRCVRRRLDDANARPVCQRQRTNDNSVVSISVGTIALPPIVPTLIIANSTVSRVPPSRRVRSALPCRTAVTAALLVSMLLATALRNPT